MELKQCKKADIPAVTSFYHQVIAYLEAHTNYPCWSSEHPSDASTEEAVRRGEQYVCIHDGEILGAVLLSEDPDGDYDAGDWSRKLEQGEYLSLHVLAVKPDCFHSGVGSFMVESCIAIAQKGGYKALRLDIVPTNTPAERLYRKMGFVYAGTADLKRKTAPIPLFDLYELDLDQPKKSATE